MDEILTIARDLEWKVNEDDIEELVMGHKDELTTELQEILNEEHQETQLLVTDDVILNHGQVTWTTPETAPTSPNYHTTPMGGHFSSQQI
ncbi:hypothetical protein TNCV_1778541 [Trichonephila clavipes]|nr:hypothetical protein TNCV_1778541 [Trichonephila clavipes]